MLKSDNQKYTAINLLSRIFKEYIYHHRKILCISIFFMVIVAFCSAALVYFVKDTIDQILVAKSKYQLMIMIFLMLFITTIKGISEYFQYSLIRAFGQRILTDMQMKLYKHLLSSDLSLIAGQSSGRLISRFTNDISLMRGAVSNLLIGMAKHFLSASFLMLVMIRLEPMLSLLVFVVFPIAIFPVLNIGRKMRKLSTSTQEELGNFTARLDEVFDSIRIIKSYQAEQSEFSRAQNIVEKIFVLYKKAVKVDSLTSPVMEVLCGIAFGVILWYGGLNVIHGYSSPGSLVAFITAFFSAYRPLKSLVALNTNLQDGLAAAKRLFVILDTKPQIIDKKNAYELAIDTCPNLEFQNISLTLSERMIVKNLSFKVNAGDVAAIVGRSGSGKTTLTNLLVRFYEPDSGKILINNHDISDMKINSLRSNTALVTQDIMLFDATIGENIAYGSPSATEQQIREAAIAANADEFISKLPDGYQTMIGSKGAMLSGGQKQRLSIARAFLKNAPILILDEATSSLDPIAEKEIKNSLKKLCKNKTTLIIAHKLTAIIDANVIHVMQDGQIIESGTHKDLIANDKSEYQALYKETQHKH